MLDVSRIVASEEAFTTTTELQSVGTGETDFLLLKNPSGSGKKLLITHFTFGVDSASTRSIIRTYSNPTITDDGTALAVVNTYIKASPLAPVAEAYVNPTISAKGGRLNMVIRSADADSRGMSRYYWIDPGNSILLTCDNSIGNSDSFADVYWLEF